MEIRNDLRLAKVPGCDIHLYLDDKYLPDKGKIKAAVDNNPEMRGAFIRGVTNGRIPAYDLMTKSPIQREAENVMKRCNPFSVENIRGDTAIYIKTF